MIVKDGMMQWVIFVTNSGKIKNFILVKYFLIYKCVRLLIGFSRNVHLPGRDRPIGIAVKARNGGVGKNLGCLINNLNN